MSGGLPDYTKRVRIGLGSVAANLIGGPGTVSVSRIPAITNLGTTLKSRLFGVSVPAVQLNTGSFIRAYHLTVPLGVNLKVWQMGIKQTQGSAGTTGLVAQVFSDSQGTPYRQGTMQYLAGTPLVVVPTGTRASLRLENNTGVKRNVTAYFFSSLE